jgi:hypothetical protein
VWGTPEAYGRSRQLHSSPSLLAESARPLKTTGAERINLRAGSPRCHASKTCLDHLTSQSENVEWPRHAQSMTPRESPSRSREHTRFLSASSGRSLPTAVRVTPRSWSALTGTPIVTLVCNSQCSATLTPAACANRSQTRSAVTCVGNAESSVGVRRSASERSGLSRRRSNWQTRVCGVPNPAIHWRTKVSARR